MRALDSRLLRRARSARRLLSADVAIGFAMALLVLVQATVLARIVALAFHGASLADVAPDLVALALAFAARGALAWGFAVAGRRAASTVLSELRLALVERRLRTQPAALDRAEAGEIAAAAVPGVEALEAYFARYVPQVVLACLIPIAVLAWVAPIDLESAGIMLLTLPLVPVFMWLVGMHTEQRTRRRWQELRLLSTHFLDVVRALPTLRAFNRGPAQAERIAEISERYRRATMGTLRVSFLSGTVLELAATLGVALVAVTVGVRLVNGGLGLEAGLTVLVLAPELYLPLRRLGAEYHASADGLAVANRILDLIEAPAAVGDQAATRAPSTTAAVGDQAATRAPSTTAAVGNREATRAPSTTAAVGNREATRAPSTTAAVGNREASLAPSPATAVGDGATRVAPSPAVASVRLEAVRFAYPARAATVLDGVDLELAPGETVALVGESGAGKSTIAALLLRLIEPTAGRVSVGGVDVAECEADAWRRSMAWVPQHPTLLRATVADNIRLGDAEASDERVRAAAALAGADRFVEALPDRWDTRLGDGERPLSAGERRRIGLARAFLRDAPLLVLDEPTADLDPANAELIADAVDRACAGRTVLVIAHRPELIHRADRVIRLAGGKATTEPVMAVA